MTDETRAPEEIRRTRDRRHGGRRLRDLAVVLPVALLLFFLPPYIRIFDQDGLISGLPPLLVYIFGLWALGILASALLGRGLVRAEMNQALESSSEVEGREPPERPHASGRET